MDRIEIVSIAALTEIGRAALLQAMFNSISSSLTKVANIKVKNWEGDVVETDGWVRHSRLESFDLPSALISLLPLRDPIGAEADSKLNNALVNNDPDLIRFVDKAAFNMSIWAAGMRGSNHSLQAILRNSDTEKSIGWELLIRWNQSE